MKKIKAREDTEIYVKELIENFLLEKQADGRSPKTIESYRDSLKKFLNYYSEDLKAKEISSQGRF